MGGTYSEPEGPVFKAISPFSGIQYSIVIVGADFKDAMELCEESNQDLAIIPTSEDFNFLRSLISSEEINSALAFQFQDPLRTGIWVGIQKKDRVDEADLSPAAFEFIDGTSNDFFFGGQAGVFPWEQFGGASPQPDNFSDDEECVEIRGNFDSLLNDNDCDIQNPFVCSSKERFSTPTFSPTGSLASTPTSNPTRFPTVQETAPAPEAEPLPGPEPTPGFSNANTTTASNAQDIAFFASIGTGGLGLVFLTFYLFTVASIKQMEARLLQSKREIDSEETSSSVSALI